MKESILNGYVFSLNEQVYKLLNPGGDWGFLCGTVAQFPALVDMPAVAFPWKVSLG